LLPKGRRGRANGIKIEDFYSSQIFDLGKKMFHFNFFFSFAEKKVKIENLARFAKTEDFRKSSSCLFFWSQFGLTEMKLKIRRFLRKRRRFLRKIVPECGVMVTHHHALPTQLCFKPELVRSDQIPNRTNTRSNDF
jgi:hypothetical protein